MTGEFPPQHTAVLIATGLALGITGSIACTRVLRGALYGVSATGR